jgi:methyl-accepting chemotaxis protein
VKSSPGIRTKVILLVAVPLIFLVLNLGLVMLLARSSLQFALLSQRVARVHQQADLLMQNFEHMSQAMTTYAKTHKPGDLAKFDDAKRSMTLEETTLEEQVRGDKILEPPARRYVKDVRAVVVLFTAGRNALQAGRMRELLLMMSAPSSKALGVEYDASKAAFSVATATTVFVVTSAWQRSVSNVERLLLISSGLGILSTLVLSVLFGVRMARRLEMLAENARRLRAGETATPLAGSDEITQLDRVYRAMFEQIVAANHELETLRETERAAKLRLERSVRAYGELAAEVAAGDLSARVVLDDPDDELGQLGSSLNAMAASLESLVDEIRSAATSLASATAEILAATSQQVSSATEEATAVQQTAVTVLEVRQTAEMAARKTKLVAELAQRVERTAESGRQSVEESVRGSEGAKERMEALAELILAFSDQALAIAEINATVAMLADQSNLLAMNAGIEAAKAGEAGRGFAVVAAEVKDFGARSKEATLQVRRIVAEIQRLAQDAVIAAEQGMRVAESGSTVARRSGEAMDVLVSSISEASEAAMQISASAEQQEAGMDQIALAMQSIEQASVQSVAATRQVQSAADDLSRLAQQLTETLGRHVGVPGSTRLDLIN